MINIMEQALLILLNIQGGASSGTKESFIDIRRLFQIKSPELYFNSRMEVEVTLMLAYRGPTSQSPWATAKRVNYDGRLTS